MIVNNGTLQYISIVPQKESTCINCYGKMPPLFSFGTKWISYAVSNSYENNGSKNVRSLFKKKKHKNGSN